MADTATAEAAIGAAPGAEPRVAVGESRRLLRNITALAGGQVVTWSMTLLWTLVVPRILGPAGLGLIVSAMSVSGVLGIVLGLGTRNYLVREMVVEPAAGPRLIGTAIVLRTALTPIVAIAIVVYARVAHVSHEGAIVLYLVSASTVITLLMEPLQAAFQAMERMKYLAYSDVINKSALSVLGIAIALAGLGPVGIGANMAAVAAAVMFVNALWLRGRMRVNLRASVRRCVAMARESMPYWTFGIFGMFYLWIDAMMLSLMTRPEVVGWYGAPVRVFQTLMFIPVLLSTAWLPRLVSAFREGGRARLIAASRTPIEVVVVLSAPVAAGTAMVAGPMIRLFYGDAYGPALAVMVILGLCIPGIYANIVLSQVLLAAKRQIVWTWLMIGAAIVNPLMNLALIPATESRYGNGAIGAAICLLITELLQTAGGLYFVGRDVFDRHLVRRCALAAVAAAAMWLVAFVARPLGTPVSLLAGCLTFLVLALALRIATPGELAALRNMLVRVPRRRR
jgi:O-antigen/teichoic acid export membrane protein